MLIADDAMVTAQLLDLSGSRTSVQPTLEFTSFAAYVSVQERAARIIAVSTEYLGSSD